MAEATIDQQFIEYIVKALVGEPEKVRIERSIDERGVLLELYVGPDDLGRVIGRMGTTAKSIRTLLRALGVKNDARYNLKIVDTNGGGRPPREGGYNNQRSDGYPTTTAPASASDAQAAHPVADAPAGDAPQDSTDASSTQTDEPAAEEPTQQTDEPVAEEDKMSRHREDLKDLTDLDI